MRWQPSSGSREGEGGGKEEIGKRGRKEIKDREKRETGEKGKTDIAFPLSFFPFSPVSLFSRSFCLPSNGIGSLPGNPAPNTVRVGGGRMGPLIDQLLQFTVHPSAEEQVGPQLDSHGHVPVVAGNRQTTDRIRFLAFHRSVPFPSRELPLPGAGCSGRNDRFIHYT